MKIDSIQKKLKKELKPQRYEHTIGVAYTASSLAMCYRSDMEQAFLSGLLHDCAKCMSDKELLKICSKQLKMKDADKLSSDLLHTYAGPYIAQTEYEVEDEMVLNAIRYHSTGRPHMTLLEKIIFVADYIEPNRYKAKNLTEVRALAYKDIDASIVRISYDTLEYLRQKNAVISPETEETYNYYCNNLKG